MEKKNRCLLVFHGSRSPGALSHARFLQKQICLHSPDLTIEIAFLQFSSPSLQDTLTDLANQGVEKIYVLPMLLLPGTHAENDIPAILESFRSMNPHPAVELFPIIGKANTLPSFIGEACHLEIERSRNRI